MPPFTLLLITTAVLVLFILVMTSSALRIVPEYKRLVVFRLGRMIGARGPGLVLLLPFIDLAAAVDLRQQTAQLKAESLVTQDKALVDAQIAISYHIVDPVQCVLHVANMQSALDSIAGNALRDIFAKQAYSDLIYARERISADLIERLRDGVKDWGIEITGVDLQEPQKRQTA